MSRDKRLRKGAAPEAGAPDPGNPRPRPGLLPVLCALLVAVTLAAFWRLHAGGFVLFDDDLYVTENTHVARGLTGESIAWAFTTTEAANWHPVTWISHMLDVQLFGMDAGRHHLTSILLHALNAVLLLLLLFRMTGALWRSAFVAALFALHPLHVESVAWIAERKDVLSTLFWLLTTGAWLAYVKSKKPAPYALMMAFFALGLMAKPMLVTLPFTLLLFDYWPLQRMALPWREHFTDLKKLVWEKAPLFAMAAVSCIVTFIVQRGGGAVKSMEAFPFDQRAANAAHACWAYLGKTFLPSGLAFFYPHAHTGLFSFSGAAAALALAGAAVIVFRLRKKAPYLAFGWCWYLAVLAPVIGLVQVGDQGMADRYTYVPLIGIFIAAAWGAAEIVRRNRGLRLAAAATAAAVLALLFAATRIQTGYWMDSEALFGRALAVTPDNAPAHNGFGLVLCAKGRTAEAVAHYMDALQIDPNSSDVHNNLGIALVTEGRLADAVEHYRQALRINPEAVKILNNLGVALARLGRFPDARAGRFGSIPSLPPAGSSFSGPVPDYRGC